MASIITLFSAVQIAAKAIGKLTHNSEIEDLAVEIGQELKSPGFMRHKAKMLYDKLNSTYNDLSPSDRQEFQNILSQSCTEQGITAPFDANGNLDIRFDYFLTECETIADSGEIVGDTTEIASSVGECEDVVSDAAEIMSDGIDSVSDAADSAVDGADSIWDFISSLFN